MGASQSTTVAPVQGVNKEVIRTAMRSVFDTFNAECGKGLSQTDLFKKIMTTKQEEFKAFDANNLGSVFTDRGKCFPELKGSYNNCFLFRDSQTGVFHIPLRSNGKFVIATLIVLGLKKHMRSSRTSLMKTSTTYRLGSLLSA